MDNIPKGFQQGKSKVECEDDDDPDTCVYVYTLTGEWQRRAKFHETLKNIFNTINIIGILAVVGSFLCILLIERNEEGLSRMSSHIDQRIFSTLMKSSAGFMRTVSLSLRGNDTSKWSAMVAGKAAGKLSTTAAGKYSSELRDSSQNRQLGQSAKEVKATAKNAAHK